MGRFTPHSTLKAQIAAWIIKLCDSNNNRDPDRIRFLDDWRARAIALERTDNHDEAVILRQKIQEKTWKVQLYEFVTAFMGEKLNHVINPNRGVPGNTNALQFALSPLGERFTIPGFAHAMHFGFGQEFYDRFVQGQQIRAAARNTGLGELSLLPTQGDHHDSVPRPYAA